MNEREFCYWLQGYSEISGETPSKEEWMVIKEHLSLVFTKITPPKERSTQEQIKDVLQKNKDLVNVYKPLPSTLEITC